MSDAPIRTLADLLADCNLGHLASLLASDSLGALTASFDADGRAWLLDHLKQAGITKLAERQGLANALGKTWRAGRIQPVDANGAAPAAAYVEPEPSPGESREAWLAKMSMIPGCGGREDIDISDGNPSSVPASRPGVYRWVVDIAAWDPQPAEWKCLLDAIPAAEQEKV